MRASEKAYSTSLMWGVGLIILGLLGGGFLLMLAIAQGPKSGTPFFALAGICGIGFITGVVVTGITLTAGLRRTSGNAKTVTRFDNAKVIARYAVGPDGLPIFDDYFIDPSDPKTKFYVRLEIPTYGNSEYKCNGPVWGQCGEGMVGTALIQGEWIGQFSRIIGSGQGNPYLSESSR